MPNFELEAKVQVWIFFGPMLVMLAAVLLAPFGNPFALALVGIAAFGSWKIIKSKIQLKRRSGVAIEWGIKGMTSAEKRSYVWGYVLLVSAIAFLIWMRFS